MSHICVDCGDVFKDQPLLFAHKCQVQLNRQAKIACSVCKKGVVNYYGWCSVCNTEDYDSTMALRSKIESDQNIKQQAHYTQHKIQPVVFIGENRLDFLSGNVIKYVSRYNLKNGVEDLEKARHYLDMLIQREKEGKIVP